MAQHRQGHFLSGPSAAVELFAAVADALRRPAMAFSIAVSALLAVPDAVSAQESASEVERLKSLLRSYHSATADTPLEQDAEAGPEPAISNEELRSLLAKPFAPDKQLLSDKDIEALYAFVEAQLQDSALPERRHDTANIIAIQSRRGAALMSSNTRSLAHLGRYQFAGVVDMRGGHNTLTVSERQWRIELPPDFEVAAYLLTLSAPPGSDWELHAIPLDALAHSDAPVPHWLAAPLARAPQ